MPSIVQVSTTFHTKTATAQKEFIAFVQCREIFLGSAQIPKFDGKDNKDMSDR